MQIHLIQHFRLRHVLLPRSLLPKLLLIAAGLLLANQAWSLDHYTARYDAPSETMAVEACFGLPLPTRLVHHESASRFSAGILVQGSHQRLRRHSTSSPVPGMAKQHCLNWQVNLGKAVDARTPESRGQRDSFRVGPDLVMDPSLWLWRAPGTRDLRIRMELPPGIRVSAPWAEQQAEPGIIEFRPQQTPSSWTSRFAIGRFESRTVPVGGTLLRLAILGGLSQSQQDKLSQWISQAASAVGSVYGEFPRKAPQILVVPIGARRGPVPWAHVLRGGGPAAEFFVDENQSLEAFSSDWTACHELSHLLLPFVSSRDRWLSEGLASYYQYILLARAGILSEQQAWQGLYDGLGRGQAGAGNNTLAEATLAGYRDTMRVYWSGAAMMLLADVELRTVSGGAQSLDTVLSGLKNCCVDSDKRWRAKDLFLEMDRISGTRVFTTLLTRYVNSTDFPDASETWNTLGIDTSNSRVSFRDNLQAVQLRSAIMKSD